MFNPKIEYRLAWRDAFKRYDYIRRTSFGERAGEILVDEAVKFVAESPAPEKPAER